MTLDERRRKLDLKKVAGGATIYLQQQDHSLEAIAARDAMLVAQAEAGPVEPAPPANDNADAQAEAQAAKALYELQKGLS